jgi:hypothetical protein
MSFDPVLTAEKFMTAYRAVEKSAPKAATDIIKYVVKDEHIADHLCDSWEGRKQNWGDFYLNLSHTTQYTILKFWGLGHPAGEEYLVRMKENPRAMLFEAAPDCILWPHELLKFFYNHGIDETPTEGVTLSTLPRKNKRYGNSGNWADYILSLQSTEQERVLKQIAAISIEARK